MEVEDTADAYGRREGCFIDHQSRAFSFEEAVKSLQLKATSGIIHQPDLTAASFPLTKIKFDGGNDPVASRRAEDLCHTAPNKRPMPFLSNSALVRDSDIRLELPKLTSNPDGDVEEYVRMVRSRLLLSDLSTQWLPLSPTKIEKDEGLQFPKHAGRLRALLLRELECERVSDSGESVLLDDSEPPSILGQLSNIHVNGQRFQSQRCTPPLTPIAEDSTPYVPSMEACQIDFTSEPQSPCRSSDARFRTRLEIGQVGSDIASAASLTASPGLPVFHPDRGVNPRDLMLDEPMVDKEVNRSSVAKGETYPSKDLPVLEFCKEDVVMDDQPADGYFDEDFAAILEDRRFTCMRTVEQERFDPVDSIARIRVPAMEFSVPPPRWEQHTQGSRQMFEWVLSDAAWAQSAHSRPISNDYNSMLKWAPFAPTAGRVSTTESVDIPEDVLGSLLETQPPLVSSRSHVRQDCALRVAHLGSDDDIEAPPESGPTKSAVGARVSPHFRTQRSGSLQPEATSAKGLDDLVKAAASKRKASALDCMAINNQNLLPFSSDSKATSRLLSGFMELRGRQTSSRDREHGPSIRTGRNVPHEVGLPVPIRKSDIKSSKSPTPASAPEFVIPAKKGTYIFSLALPRAVLRHIEQSWPKEQLIDRDYSHRSTVAWSPGSARRKEETIPPAHEADISLTPTTGLIVTTLLKAKQRSLPNAKALPQLRERVLEVSRKYESLIVLVSESNSAGEYANELPSSDMEAYAEFVRFASALQARVTVHLVPGAEGTLAKWVLKLMCEQSPRNREVSMFIQAQETSWEIFFRRGGMNVLAAQAMAGVFHQRMGNQGLAGFKAMSTEQRIATYGSFLGGPKLFANFSNTLGQSWE